MTLAVRTPSSVEQVLRSCFPDAWLEQAARAAGWLQRLRKVTPAAFFWTVVLGFGAAATRTLAAVRRQYEGVTETLLVPSAFYDRWTPALARWLKAAVALAITHVAEPLRGLPKRLAAFRDLVLADATVVRLHALLAPVFPACRTNHTRAAAKLHLVMSVLGGGPKSVTITAERRHEVRQIRIGPSVRGCLLLFDLGFFHYQLFHRIARNSGWFLSRLKDSANPVVMAEHETGPGRRRPLVGQRVHNVLSGLSRSTLDVEVELAVRHRRYAAGERTRPWRCRLVGVRDAKTGAWHRYLTNIPPDRLTPEELSQIYRARWEVELIFRDLKTHFRLDQLPSRKAHIVEALLWAAILTLIVSRLSGWTVRDHRGVRRRCVPDHRWTAVFSTFALQVLWHLLHPRGGRPSLDRVLRHEAVDPNRSRRLNHVLWMGSCAA